MVDIGGSQAVEDAKQSAREALQRLSAALEQGTMAQVARAAERAYLPVGRLAALAGAASKIRN